MWNQWNTDTYDGMIAEPVSVKGDNNETFSAYLSRPLGPGPYPGIVLVHHLPGWDELYREMARRLSQHGYVVLCPDMYHQFGSGTPEEVAASARGAGGVSDNTVLSDCKASMESLRSLPYSSGKVGIMGSCSGGRHAFLVACRVEGFDAVVECWGGKVVMSDDQLTPQQPVAPLEYTAGLSCPMLGLFGNDDQSPPPDQVDQHEEELKKHGKNYEFHRYDGAGHGFWYYDRPAYRATQAMDGWNNVFAFFAEHLQS